MNEAPARPRPRGRPRTVSTGETVSAPIKALDRGMVLLRSLADEDRATLTNIALETGMTPSSAYRILVTLERHGLVEFDEGTQEWSVGIEAFRVGRKYLARTGLVEIARPSMRALMQVTDETANLAMADRDDVVFVAQVESRHPVRAFFEAGARGHMHASGIGKALLAAYEPSALDTFVETKGLPRFTERTLVSTPDLQADLARIRERGWSLDDEEGHAGMRCLAAAIRDDQGRVVAGVSISGPSARFPDTALDALAAHVVTAAADITRRYGG